MASPLNMLVQGAKRVGYKTLLELKKLVLFLIIDGIRALSRGGMPVVNETPFISLQRWYDAIGDEAEDINVRAWVNAQVGVDWLTLVAMALTTAGVLILGMKYAALHPPA